MSAAPTPGAPTPDAPFVICMMNAVFDEVAESLRHGFERLGVTAPVMTAAFPNGARPIILGAQLVQDWGRVPRDAIIFNFEQLGAPSTYITDEYLRQLTQHTVWDYSPRNIGWLKAHQITETAQLVRIGHSPGLIRLPLAPVQDIDVLFYGAVNPRRHRILAGLAEAGLKVTLMTSLFGAARDQVIARAKVVLNMHYYETRIFEIARAGFLMANGKAVVTEANPDTELEDALRPGLLAVPYEGLVEGCRALVADGEWRQSLGAAAAAVYATRDQAFFLKDAVAAALSGSRLEGGRDPHIVPTPP